MQRFTHPGLLALLTAAALWGCATPRPDPAVEPAQPAAVDTPSKPAVTGPEFEDRVKALARYATGISRDVNNQADLALEEFYESVKADPANKELAVEVARRFLQKREPAKAIEILERTVKLPEATGMVHAMLGLAYVQANRPDDAIAACERAINKSPESIIGYRTLFQLHSSGGHPDQALAVLKRAGKVPDREAIYLIELADLLIAHLRANPRDVAKETPLLLEWLRLAEAKEPRLPLLVQRLAEGFFFAGEPASAARHYLTLVNRFPNSLVFRQRLVEIHLRANDKQGAILQLETLLREQPTNPQSHYFLGLIAAEDREWDKAVTFYRRVIQLNEQFEPVYFDLAGVLISQDKSEDALALLATARKRFKESFAIEYYTALALGRKKAYADAVRHYTAAELLAKRDEPARLTPFFYFQAGTAYERNQDFAQAARLFQQALELNPDFPEALNYLGYMWAERGENLERAKTMIEKAVTMEPENSAFLDSMGWVLFQLGKVRESLPWLEKSIEIAEKEKDADVTLYDHLGDVHFKLGDWRKAREQFEKALQLEAKPEIQRKLDEVKQRLRGAR